MPVNFIKDLLPINPAYNDSIIIFNSGFLPAPSSAKISVNGVAIPFSVFPINGKFTFNFKEIIKVLINKNKFIDTVTPDISQSFVYDDSTLSKDIIVDILISDTSTNDLLEDYVQKVYSFTKGVEQLAGYRFKLETDNNVRVLLPSKNYYDYTMPYFEGYPCEVDIYGIESGDEFYFKNVTTVNQSPTFTPSTNYVKRVYFSDGGYNESTYNLLSLSTTSNHVELWVNDTFKANIKIQKFESRCGVYLKWFNQNGGYSYWLFDSVYNENYQTKTMDELKGQYFNLQDINTFSIITGKEADSSYRLKTNFTDEYKDLMKSLLSSPVVEMYIHQSPFNQTAPFKFVGVNIKDGSASFSNKTSNNKLEITITLPEIQTQSI